MLRYSPRAGNLPNKLRRGPPTRSVSRTPNFSNEVRRTRALPAVLGLGALAGAAAYLFYPDASRSAPTSTKRVLSASHFTPAAVTSNESCGPDTKLLELTVPPHLLPPHDPSGAHFAPVWSVFIKDDDIQVERPYTPLEGVDEHGRMLFWIKKYPKGEVGRWLHSKNIGEQVELRGPLRTWPWKDDTWDEIVMISGGTGITPFYQLFHSTISSQSGSSQSTRFTLLHSSRTPADLPPPQILDTLSTFASEHPEKFRLHLFVDRMDGSPSQKIEQVLQVGRIGKPAIEQSLGLHGQGSWWNKIFSKPAVATTSSKKILFLVCGPDLMISAISGPYGSNFSQGSVGGVLGEMGFTSKEVWKL